MEDIQKKHLDKLRYNDSVYYLKDADAHEQIDLLNQDIDVVGSVKHTIYQNAKDAEYSPETISYNIKQGDKANIVEIGDYYQTENSNKDEYVEVTLDNIDQVSQLQNIQLYTAIVSEAKTLGQIIQENIQDLNDISSKVTWTIANRIVSYTDN